MSGVQNINITDEVKNFLNLNHQLLIDGNWVQSVSGEKIPVYDPATEELLAEVDSGNAEDIDAAVISARQALTGEWSKIPSHDRASIINRLADQIESKFDILYLHRYQLKISIWGHHPHVQQLDVPHAIVLQQLLTLMTI